jgi:DNA repair photolyase
MGPYVGCEHGCLYCFTQNDVELDWDTQVGVYPDFRRRLVQELDELEPQLIYVGNITDPYQPIESEYRHTRIALEEMARRGFSASVLTKSPRVVSDIDVLRKMRGSQVGVSVCFNDEDTRALFERSTDPIDARIQTLVEVKQAGIETYALICPVMPFITDVESLIDNLGPHADTIWIYSLNMQSSQDKNWNRIEPIIAERFSDIEDGFAAAAFSDEHPYWLDLRQELDVIAKKEGLRLEIHV